MAAKNITIAIILLGIVAFAALAFQPGSVSTVGTGGGDGWSMGGQNQGGGTWGRGDDDEWDDD